MSPDQNSPSPSASRHRQLILFFLPPFLLTASQNNSAHKTQTGFAICENVWLPRAPWRRFTGRETAIDDPCFCALRALKRGGWRGCVRAVHWDWMWFWCGWVVLVRPRYPKEPSRGKTWWKGRGTGGCQSHCTYIRKYETGKWFHREKGSYILLGLCSHSIHNIPSWLHLKIQ